MSRGRGGRQATVEATWRVANARDVQRRKTATETFRAQSHPNIKRSLYPAGEGLLSCTDMIRRRGLRSPHLLKFRRVENAKNSTRKVGSWRCVSRSLVPKSLIFNIYYVIFNT